MKRKKGYRIEIIWAEMSFGKKITAIFNFALALFGSKRQKWVGNAKCIHVKKL